MGFGTVGIGFVLFEIVIFFNHPPTFCNCLAQSVSQRAISTISHTINFRMAMAQNQTIWTKAQSKFGPHIDKTHAGRACMTAR